MKYIATVLTTLWVAGLGLAIWDHFQHSEVILLAFGAALIPIWLEAFVDY